MREACQIFFFSSSCRKEGEVLKDIEDQGSTDNQEIRTKQSKREPEGCCVSTQAANRAKGLSVT